MSDAFPQGFTELFDAFASNPARRCLSPQLAKILNIQTEKLGAAANELDRKGAQLALATIATQVTRSIGAGVSAHGAFALMDGPVMQMICMTADEGRAWDLALPFVERYLETLEMAGETDPAPFKPDPELFIAQARGTREIIESLSLDDESRAALLDPVARLEAYAAEGLLPASVDGRMVAMSDFMSTVSMLEASVISPPVASLLRGRMIFAAPAAATCIIPITWPWQIAIGLLVLVVGGVWYFFYSQKARLAARNLNRTAGNMAKTNKQLDKEVDDAAKGMDQSEIDELKDFLEKRRKALKKDKLTPKKEKRLIEKRLDRMIKRLEGITPE